MEPGTGYSDTNQLSGKAAQTRENLHTRKSIHAPHWSKEKEQLFAVLFSGYRVAKPGETILTNLFFQLWLVDKFTYEVQTDVHRRDTSNCDRQQLLWVPL